MSKKLSLSTDGAMFYICIASIILLYSSILFTIPQFIKFIHYAFINASSGDPFFQMRQPIITTIYISSFIFVLYILYPLILILINVNIPIQFIPMYINDFGNILLFSSFFSRAWVLVFDRYFCDNLQNWVWRREVNAKESDMNILIKYRDIFRLHRRSIITSVYIVFIVPIFSVLMILSYIHYAYIRILCTLILLLLLCFTLYMIENKISIVTDEHLIQKELLHTMKTSGTLYIITGLLYSLYTIGYKWCIILEILCISLGHLCSIYWSCSWTRTYFEHMIIASLNNKDVAHRRRSFFKSFNQSKHIGFIEIMSHRAGIEAFAHHLAVEYGLESILFIIEVSQFKGVIGKRDSNVILPISETDIFCAETILSVYWMPLDPRMKRNSPYKIAIYLYDKYIESSADLCINISSTNRRNIYKCFKELAQRIPDDVDMNMNCESVLAILYTLFDDALIEIWHLIEQDTFTRFKSTKTFERLLHELYPKQSKKALIHSQEVQRKQIKRIEPIIKIKIAPSPDKIEESESFEFNIDEEMNKNGYKDNISSIHDEIMIIENIKTTEMGHSKRSASTNFMNNNKNLLNLTRPQLDFRAKSSRIDDITDNASSLSNTVIVPSDIIKNLADFWRLNINRLCSADKLEIGVTMYLSMIATDRSIQYLFKKNHKIKQEQIEKLSLKFLDMICWLIQSLWDRNDNDLNSLLSKLGRVHKSICIEIKHFNVMLKVVHETLSFYFPVRYRLQEQYAMDYIFAYSAEIMMDEALSNDINKYKTLEQKFNSEKKTNEFIKNHNKTGLKLDHEISAPIHCTKKIKSKIASSTSASFNIKSKISPKIGPLRIPKLKDAKSNSLSVGLITPI